MHRSGSIVQYTVSSFLNNLRAQQSRRKMKGGLFKWMQDKILPFFTNPALFSQDLSGLYVPFPLILQSGQRFDMTIFLIFH